MVIRIISINKIILNFCVVITYVRKTMIQLVTVTHFIKKIIQKSYNYIHRLRFRQYYKNKINNITKALGKVPKYDVHQHVNLWTKLVKRVNPQWYIVYSSVSNIKDINYVPEDLYYVLIEPCLNREELGLAIRDKNLSDKYFSNLSFPETILRNMDGQYYDKDYRWLAKDEIDSFLKSTLIDYTKIIAKPSLQSGGGREIHAFDLRRDSVNMAILEKIFDQDFIVQEYIYQSEYFSQFNESSLNCIRINSYRTLKNNSIYTDEILLKVGVRGAIFDNTHAGGTYINIGTDGTLGDFAVNGLGQKTFSPPGTDKLYKDFPKVPHIDELIRVSEEIARQHYYHRCLGVDICVDHNEQVRVIEINNRSIGIGSQMLNGSLFKEHTPEVIKYTKDKINSLNYPIRL